MMSKVRHILSKSTCQNLYRSIVPERARSSRLVRILKEKLLGLNWIYNSDFFDREVEEPSVRSSEIMASSILSEFSVKNVIDVGCGTGALLEALRNRGCMVFGLEYADAALKYCRRRHLDVEKLNLEKIHSRKYPGYDVAVSMEVAEHLPEKAADRYIELLIGLAPIVIFTAAVPGQGGTNHVNEQPNEYWIGKFQAHGHMYDGEITGRWRESWRISGKVQDWYYQNLMIFKKCVS